MEDNETHSAELDNAAGLLSYFLSNCRIWFDGSVIETRELVTRMDGVSIHVYSDEHPPPHFHVKHAGEQASFTIEDCEKLEGSLGNREDKIVKYWFNHGGKTYLIEVWNRTRPGDCAVGKYGEDIHA